MLFQSAPSQADEFPPAGKWVNSKRHSVSGHLTTENDNWVVLPFLEVSLFANSPGVGKMKQTAFNHSEIAWNGIGYYAAHKFVFRFKRILCGAKAPASCSFLQLTTMCRFELRFSDRGVHLGGLVFMWKITKFFWYKSVPEKLWVIFLF